VSFDVCGLEAGEVCLDLSLPSATLGADPSPLVDALVRAGPLDLVLGPGGYGLPLMRARNITAKELSQMLLLREDEHGARVGIAGMRAIVRALLDAGLPLVFGPGVIHLPTVPAYRKWNRIDMGTADKVASAALCLADQARRLHIEFAECSFIMLELGGAFSAALAVDEGRIVDGLGGSSGPIGAQACGALDGEVAYLLGAGLSKATVFGGGALSANGEVDIANTPVEMLRRDPRLREGWLALEESAAKAVLALTAVARAPREVLVTGRLARAPGLLEALGQRLGQLAPVLAVAGLGTAASTAAQGAALIADGLAGGAFAPLAQRMRIHQAAGCALDHLHLPGAHQIRLA
jgi:predicted butyrate kinase (DUF1464 family)